MAEFWFENMVFMDYVNRHRTVGQTPTYTSGGSDDSNNLVEEEDDDDDYDCGVCKKKIPRFFDSCKHISVLKSAFVPKKGYLILDIDTFHNRSRLSCTSCYKETKEMNDEVVQIVSSKNILLRPDYMEILSCCDDMPMDVLLIIYKMLQYNNYTSDLLDE